jgi:hypothetical protein
MLTSDQGDTSVIRDKEIKSGKVGGCGRTGFGGNTDVAASLIGTPPSYFASRALADSPHVQPPLPRACPPPARTAPSR